MILQVKIICNVRFSLILLHIHEFSSKPSGTIRAEINFSNDLKFLVMSEPCVSMQFIVQHEKIRLFYFYINTTLYFTHHLTRVKKRMS